MSSIRSDNNLYTNPKPAQEYERKFNGTDWEDWASTAEVDAVFATPPLSPTYKDNKYFWIAGVYMEYTGTEWRTLGGGSVDADNGLNTDTGPVQLGGTLIKDTFIFSTGFEFSTRLQTVDTTTQTIFGTSPVGSVMQTNTPIASARVSSNEAIAILAYSALDASYQYYIAAYADGLKIGTKTSAPTDFIVGLDADDNAFKIPYPAAGLGSLSYVVGDDPGPPYDGFDGYVPAGNVVTLAALIGKQVVSMTYQGIVSQCWVPGNKNFLFDTATGEIDNSNQGGFFIGDWFIIQYK